MSEQKMREALKAVMAYFENDLAYSPHKDDLYDICRAALAEQPAQGEVVEMSPDFTDTSRAALLWVLWHHQGGSSPIGQPLRFALGMGKHQPLNDCQIQEAKRWAALTKSTTAEFHAPPAPSVPEMRANESPYHDAVLARTYAYGWNACRDAMLVAASEASK